MRDLVALYRRAHNLMRNIDGLQPQEAFDEMLKFLFFKQALEGGLAFTWTPKAMRKAFAQRLAAEESWSAGLWRDRDFHLSDACLQELEELFIDVHFENIDADIRSAALREFLTPEVRKGLGIFLTPDDVVREMVAYVNPSARSRNLDPACGSGTFLMEVVKHGRKQGSKKISVWGADKNPRMMMLAELNLGHFPGATFHHHLMDSLTEVRTDQPLAWCRPGYFDCIFTNPPFGVSVDTRGPSYASYSTVHTSAGEQRAKQGSEWLFVEQALRWLKPGGTLAIVLPRSVLNNPSASLEREAIAQMGRLKALFILPPETFLVTGAQTNTVVAFIEKYTTAHQAKEPVDTVVATLTNVGYDSTGRPRTGNQLDGLADLLRASEEAWPSYIRKVRFATGPESLDVLVQRSPLPGPRAVAERRLGELALTIRTGRTPARSAYSEGDGLFLVKVGNLTGAGISWLPRDRNFISLESKKTANLQLLQSGDLVLTSSAHSPVYIAKKIDLVTTIPEWVGGRASFVGEVMLVRADPKQVEPALLLAYLRRPSVTARIQEMVRGQTAHLHPDNLAELSIPEEILSGANELRELTKLIEREAEMNEGANEVAWAQLKLLARLDAELA